MKNRPLLAWLWPSPPPGPVDDEAVQRRWTRVGHRGPLRLSVLALATILLVAAMGTMVFTVTLTASRLDDLIGAIAFSVAALILARAWSLGTYVNDGGLKVVRMTRTIAHPWPNTRLSEEDHAVYLHSGERVWRTHIAQRNLDFLMRGEAYLIARDQVFNWWQAR